jgi:hypothetical protein
VEGFLGLPKNTPDPLGFLPEDADASRAAIARIAAALGSY